MLPKIKFFIKKDHWASGRRFIHYAPASASCQTAHKQL